MNNNGDPAAMLCVLGIFAVVAVVFIAVWWKIFEKAGYSGALALLMIIPIVSLIMMLVLAFGDWPVQQEVRRLRRELAELEEYGRGGGSYGGRSQGLPRKDPEGEGETGYRQ